jgi:hypothetical protein
VSSAAEAPPFTFQPLQSKHDCPILQRSKQSLLGVSQLLRATQLVPRGVETTSTGSFPRACTPPATSLLPDLGSHSQPLGAKWDFILWPLRHVSLSPTQELILLGTVPRSHGQPDVAFVGLALAKEWEPRPAGHQWHLR